MGKISPLVYVGGAAALYLLYSNSQSQAQTAVPVVAANPAQPAATTAIPVSTPNTNSVPSQTNPYGTVTNYKGTIIPVTVNAQGIPTNYGINGGYVGTNAAVATNYSTLALANPNLTNPNYQMTADEQGQYMANYADLAIGISKWPGGITPANINKHWKTNGCAEKRIFLPMVPSSAATYTPPQAAKKSGGGSSWIGAAASVAGSIIVAVAGDNDPLLNDGEVQMFMTGGAIVNDIVPFYMQSDKYTVQAIQQKLNDVLMQYS